MEIERHPLGILKDSTSDELDVVDYSVNSLMLVEGQSMWERVVEVAVDSKDWFDKGGEMVEFA